MAASVGFVGRERELSRLGTALGDVRVLLVAGDAGVGKTRLVTEGLRRAADGGVVAAWGACLPLAETLPLLPVAGVLGELSAVDGGALVEAALGVVPGYVRPEVGRLVPRLGGGAAGPGGPGGGWRRERLFAAVAELLGAVAARCAVCVVVEDVHWADSSTLDCLTFLAGAGGLGAVTLVVTCRSDEAPLDPPVAAWLAHARGGRGVEEIRLGPLSEDEAAELVARLWGGPPPERAAGRLYARAEGNPFFTEQLAAAMLAGPAEGGLPGRLAELLAARAGRCGADGGAVLAALAVAGRPLTEDQLAGVGGLAVGAVRGGLRELAAARLLAEDTTPGGGHRPRHALLAEAVAAGLLPGERVVLHERTARSLAAAGDPALAAEVAGHWQAAGRPAEELPSRVAAAEAAERVFGYAEAAGHWQRAIELWPEVPGAAGLAGTGLPQLYLRAISAAELSGDTGHAGVIAEEAYRRFADHPDPAIAAVICYRAGYLRGLHDPAAGLTLAEQALELFARGPPSAEHAEALLEYARFLLQNYGRWDDHLAAVNRALEMAEAAGATAVVARILARFPGDPDDPVAVQETSRFHRARAAAQAAGDDASLVEVAMWESHTLLQMADLAAAEEAAVRGLHAARRAGLESWFRVTILVANAAEAILFAGRTADAAALIDPLTAGPPRGGDWATQLLRAQLDMLRGDLAAATRRQRQVALTSPPATAENDREAAELTVEVALWAGRPGDALDKVRQTLAPYEDVPDHSVACGQLLAAGLRACADLAEQARARRDPEAAQAAQAAAAELASFLEQMEGVPFTDNPCLAQIPANRATWDAEQTRLAGASDPGAWHAAAKTWQSLGYPHRAAYAWWRHAQAQLDAGQPAPAAAAALRAAAAAADGHAPLHAQIRALAARARISLDVPAATATAAPPPAETPDPYGLTGRELAVLRLLAAGRTNNQIGAELYISPTTARVHVSNILRKLGVTSRAQAAALAERAGLLDPEQR